MRRAVYHAINVDLIVAEGAARAGARRPARYLSTLRRRLAGRARPAPAVRPGEGEGAARRGGLSERLLGDARLRQHRVARGGVPGDDGDADPGRHPRHAALVADQPVLSEADARRTVSLVEFGWTADDRRLGARCNALFRTWDKSGLGTFNAGRYSQPEARCADRRDARRARPDAAPRDGRDRAPLRRRRSAARAALPPHADLGDEDATCSAVQWPSDALELRWLRVPVDAAPLLFDRPSP